MKKLTSYLAAALVAASLTGCSQQDRCDDLNQEPLDPAAEELMLKGYEVSLELDDVECELQRDGTWTVDA